MATQELGCFPSTPIIEQIIYQGTVVLVLDLIYFQKVPQTAASEPIQCFVLEQF